MTRPPSGELPTPGGQPQHPTGPWSGAPGAPDPWYAQPQGTPHQQPGHDTEYGAALYAASRYPAPQYPASQYPFPQYGGPQYGGPAYGQSAHPYGGPPFGSDPGGRPRRRRTVLLGVVGGLVLLALVAVGFVAGRVTATGSTVPAPTATREPTGLGNDPLFDQLAQACHDGDMSSCDDLYDQSDVDSAYERYGDTCAGRREGGELAYCVDVYSDTDGSSD